MDLGLGQANSEQSELLLELFKGRILLSGILLASLGHMGVDSISWIVPGDGQDGTMSQDKQLNGR